ncbi:MAG: MBL fold metallo-hydrolase [Candidatus Kerfeldbacteria bacterium]|nr:MBL fold metallo-hydrolase [Candidatus Kerfeldbacteria bacterium]
MSRRRIILILLGIGVVATVALGARPARDDGTFRVTFFDVGQGDATFIETPDDVQVLIDGGPDSDILPLLGRTMPIGDRTIDLVVLTHPHEDHVGGLADVLERYTVRTVLETGVAYPSASYDRFQELAREQGSVIIDAQRGQEFLLARDVSMRVVAPFAPIRGQTVEDVNEASVVARLTYGEVSWLFTGDAGTQTEGTLLAAGIDLSAMTLKVGHHGSATATSARFLQVVHPIVAVASLGAGNRYGHPDGDTVERILQANALFLRTDQDGTVSMTSDGETLWVRSGDSRTPLRCIHKNAILHYTEACIPDP